MLRVVSMKLHEYRIRDDLLMVFVDEVVTMKHVNTCPRCVASHNPDDFTRSDPHNVLRTRCFIWHHLVTIPRTRQHLEVDQVDVNRVRGISTSVSQLPDLVLAQDRSCQDAVLDVFPTYAVDEPLAVNSREFEALGDVRLRRRRDVAKVGWYGVVVGAVCHGVADYEAHDAISCGEVEVSYHSALIEHCDVLALEVGEVDDDLVAFTFGDSEARRVHGVGEKSSIRTDHGEVHGLFSCIVLQV